jgi:RNAse (barnase) inhibitor barstar
MDYCKIGGRNYDVIVTAIEESFTILYTENTGRTMSNGARMTLDPIGTFFSHSITFKRSKDNVKEFDALYDFLSTPHYDGFPVEIVHNQTTLKYDAYVSQGKRPLQKISQKLSKVFWGEITVNFIAMEAQVLP